LFYNAEAEVVNGTMQLENPLIIQTTFVPLFRLKEGSIYFSNPSFFQPFFSF